MLTRADLEAIECNQCGNCCPNSCKHKERLPNGRSECKVHPLKLFGSTSTEDQIVAFTDFGRGLKCDLPPVEILSAGYYCPPVIEVLCKSSGLPLPEEKPEGRLVIPNWGPNGKWVFDSDGTGMISIKDWEEEKPIHPLRKFFEELP